MSTSLAIRKRELAADDRKVIIETVCKVGDAGKDLFIAMLNNPAMTMILANVTIELLRGVKVNRTAPGYQPGTHLANVSTQVPLISDSLATTMETIINTGEALQFLSSSAGGLGTLAKLLIK